MNFAYDAETVTDLYQDALPSIDFLLRVLAPFPESNTTAEGLCKAELLYLRQEILKKKLDVPLENSKGMPTLRRAGIVDQRLDGLDPAVPHHVLVCFNTLYEGRPRLRQKYLWLVEARIRFIIQIFQRQSVISGSPEDILVRELSRVRDEVMKGCLVLPVERERLSVLVDGISVKEGPHGELSRLGDDRDPGMVGKYMELECALFEGFCPKPPPRDPMG